MYLLIHTMTITECDYVLQAQFFHALPHGGRESQGQLIARRMRLRLHPLNGSNPVKAHLQRLQLNAHCPNLKTLMKTNKGNVRHHLRAIKISSQTAFQNANLDEKKMVSLSPASSDESEKQQEVETTYVGDLIPTSNPQHTVNWLNANRFEKFVQTFTNFSGADMFRMTREDFIEVCGHVDGIRLYNALHSSYRSIVPKLTLYVCRENSTIYNAIYLSRLTNCELVHKLGSVLNVPVENIKDVYVQGPQMIHVQLNAEMIKHIKDDTMFNVEIISNNNNNGSNNQVTQHTQLQSDCSKFAILLKPINNKNT